MACPIGDSSTDGTRRDPVPSGVFYWSEALAVDPGCTGSISRVRYCYHNSQSLVTNSAVARFSLYRRSGATYSRISNVFTITNRISAESPLDSLVCEELELGTTLQVQSRDLFGVCLPEVEDEDSMQALPIISNNPRGTTLGSQPCEDQPLDSFFRLTLSFISNVQLHLFADAGEHSCTSVL